jgi:predicted ester cyclase
MVGTSIQLVRDLLENFFNAHDPATAGRYFTADFKWHGGSVGEYSGRDAYASAMAGFWSALTGAHAVERDIFAAGDRVGARFDVEARHTGELWGVPPSGKTARWTAVMIYRIADDRVAEQWAAEDWTAILRDLGIVRPPFG